MTKRDYKIVSITSVATALITVTALFCIRACDPICIVDNNGLVPCNDALVPDPSISIDGRDEDGRVYFKVNNWCYYKKDLFRPSPELEPCGLNTTASRTWVDIYNGVTNDYRHGFCGLASRDDLKSGLWFYPYNGTPVIDSSGVIYITFMDRACNKTYKSNKVSWRMSELRITH